jgi:hypothetical protein
LGSLVRPIPTRSPNFLLQRRRGAQRQKARAAPLCTAHRTIGTMLRTAGRRLLSTAQVAQAGWQSLVKDAQGQAIKGTAQVRATSRTVSETQGVSAEEGPAASQTPACAVTSAQNWQKMVETANKVTSSDAASEAKVTVKVSACDATGKIGRMLSWCVVAGGNQCTTAMQ